MENAVAVEDSFPFSKDTTEVIIGGLQAIIKRRNRPDFVITGLFENKSAEQCIAEDKSLKNLQKEIAQVAVENTERVENHSRLKQGNDIVNVRGKR